MDKASDYESGDSRFESWRGRSFLDEKSFKKGSILSLNWRVIHLCTKTAKADEICSAETFPETLSKKFYLLEKINISGNT